MKKHRRPIRSAVFFVSVKLFSLGCSDGASICTSAAIDAGISVDYILAVALRDSLYGAALCASAARDAGIVNNICHFYVPPFFIVKNIVS